MIDPDNLEEFADARRYDIEDDSNTGLDFYATLAHEIGGRWSVVGSWFLLKGANQLTPLSF